jgi:hypothetical protein
MAQDIANFNTLLSENHLVFEKPEKFTETETFENEDMYYDYALKYDLDSFEVRYTIFPLHTLLEDYQKSLEDPNTSTLHPNKYHTSLFMANILNVSQSGMENMPGIIDFPEEAVKKEFGADYGGTSFFSANSEFGKDYKYCLMMVILKKDVADVYISFLSNNKEKFEEYMLLAFHAIKFE